MAIIDSIQSGSVTLDSDGTDTNVSITAVDLSRAWVICNLRYGASTPKTFLLAYNLSSTTNINMSVYLKTASGVVVEWQVIEFSASSGIEVQRGSYTTATSVTISSVDIADSHADVNFNNDGGAYGNDDWNRVKITGTTTLTTDDANSDTKYYQVVDWNGYASVQHVDVSQLVTDTTTKDVSITTLTDYTKTMVIGSSEFSSDKLSDDMCILYCTSNSNLRTERQGGALAMTITAQVVEFTSSEISVQQFQVTIGSGVSSNTASPTEVDTSKTIIVSGSDGNWFASGDALNDDAGAFGVTYVLTDSTTVTAKRAETGHNTETAFSVVEFDVAVVGGAMQLVNGGLVNKGLVNGRLVA